MGGRGKREVLAMSDSNPETCRRVVFSGRVQGVGFRATTEHLARRRPVTGYVKNLADGTVELVACGEPEEVERFIQAVRSHFQENLTGAAEQDHPAGIGRFQSFGVRY
jgi:acylphosphatase